MVLASVPFLVCLPGLLIFGVLSDKIGRKKTIQITVIPIILSWLILAYAESITAIMIARIFLGISFGKF